MKNGENKSTIKEQLLSKVENNGPSTFTEVQRFYVDAKHGEGTYDSGKCMVGVYVYDPKTCKHYHKTRLLNRWRGAVCGALCRYDGYLRLGHSYLEKNSDGNYVTVRNGEHKPYPKKYKYSSKANDDKPVLEEVFENKDEGRNPSEWYKPILDEKDEWGKYVESESSHYRFDDKHEPHHVLPILSQSEIIDIIESEERLHAQEIHVIDKSLEDKPRFCQWCGHELHPNGY